MRKSKKLALAKELLIDENKIKGEDIPEMSMVNEDVSCHQCKHGAAKQLGKPCPPGGSIVTEGKRKVKVVDCAGGRYYHYQDIVKEMKRMKKGL